MRGAILLSLPATIATIGGIVKVLVLGLKLRVQSVWFQVGVETETVIDIDASLHIGALIESQIALFIVSAVRLMGERRYPGALRLQSLSPLL